MSGKWEAVPQHIYLYFLWDFNQVAVFLICASSLRINIPQPRLSWKLCHQLTGKTGPQLCLAVYLMFSKRWTSIKSIRNCDQNSQRKDIKMVHLYTVLFSLNFICSLGNTPLIWVRAFFTGFAKDRKYLFMPVCFFLWLVAAGMGICELKGGREPRRKAYGEVSGINRKSLN